MKKALNYILAAMLLIGAGCAIGYDAGTRSGWPAEVEVKPDTVFVRDTFFIEKPVYKENKVVDTMYVHVRDTVVRNDTTYVRLPRESRTYGDKRYTAVVSGYEPSLDRLDIYVESSVVTERVVRKPKVNSLSAGIEAEYLNTFSLPVKVTYTRNVNSWFAVYGYGEYDLLSKQPGGGMGGKLKLEW